jgi:glycosyltransferase involved in cell wall biosynthesis
MPPLPDIAVICHVWAPYRLRVHRRIAREMPEVRLHTAYLLEKNDQPWTNDKDAATRPVIFGPGESVLAFRLYADIPFDFLKGGRVIRWLKDNNIRAVVMGGYSDAARYRAILWCRRQGIPCFLSGDSNIRADIATGLKRLIKRIVVRAAATRCDLVMPFGRRGHEYYRRYGVPDDRLSFFPYEPDYDMIGNLPQDRIEAARARFNLSPKRQKLVICSRLVRIKRVDLAIAAFTAIAAQRPQWDMIVIGSGPLMDSLRASVPEPLRRRVVFTGFIDQSADIAAVMHNSQVLVHTAERDAWGMVLNEAAAAGLAIVASDDTGAAGDLVEDGVNGRLFSSGHLASLSRCLLEVTDPSHFRPMGEASLRVLADYRRRADPVANLRAALRRFNVI